MLILMAACACTRPHQREERMTEVEILYYIAGITYFSLGIVYYWLRMNR